MEKYYTSERNAQIVIALLKANNIRKIIASPGATNITFVASIQQDPYFEIYSSVDERSAAYMACGLAAESGEPVVLSCTGATASRNYLPGLTEAFYRKLPVLAITSTQYEGRVGNHIPQVIDRSRPLNDIVHVSVSLPAVRDEEEAWSCEINANKAILALKHRGGGPAHINLATTYSRDYSVKELPSVRVIDRICAGDRFPEFPEGKVAVFVGSHPKWTSEQTEAVDRFCEAHDAVVFCDHTSNYKGRYRVLYSLVQNQKMLTTETNSVDLLIHIGEVSASYYPSARTVWRVSEDGEIRDTFHKLRYVFEMSEQNFFGHYAGVSDRHSDEYLKNCRALYQKVYDAIPQNLPFSNVWTAYKMAPLLPENSVLHFGILNTLRSWNFFEIPKSVFSDSNVGGFGIDGGVSSLIGASLADPTRLCFGIFGDLAFFYDMNAVGNRHVGNNVRILIINNGRGTEFRQYDHPGALFGDEADPYIAAAGHFGNKSQALIRHYAEDLGFEYMCASDKNEFEALYERFLSPEPAARPMLFEVFTDSGDESDALRAIRSVEQNTTGKLVDFARSVMSEKQKSFIKKTLGR